MPRKTTEPPRKRAKVERPAGEHTEVPPNIQDIGQVLRTQNPDILAKALPTLRSKLYQLPDEVVSPQDERLQLLKSWLEGSSGASDLFDAWERTNQLSTIALLVTILSSTLTLLSSHLPYHPYGLPLIRTSLSTQWIRRLSTYIGGSHNDVILATLKLFNSISAFGSGRERKAVFEAFPWDNKTLPKLLHMRRRSKGTDAGVSLSTPDIRTLYVLFILSFVDRDSPPSVKTAFLEQRREFFMGVFKGLNQDPYLVIQRVLQVSWDGLWSDHKVKRTLKIGVFSEATLSHLVKLYDRAVPEKEGELHIPADVVHHFLLAICSRPGQGICFKDRGWYSREAEESVPVDDGGTTERKRGGSGKVHNKILANFLPTLKVNEEPRQQELASKIFLASPELIAGYWSAAALTLEPRLSSKWIGNISFAGQVISQAVPTSSFFLPGTAEYNPVPPPLSTIMANILPSVGTKAHFTKGLQAGAAGLVQHCTALTLAKCLRKLAEVARTFKRVIATLEEDEEGGQWSQRRKEVEKEARRRVPEFQVIVAFSQQHMSLPNAPNTSKHALLSEISQRLLWLYQECLPDVVAEGRFEVGKLVLTLAEGSLMPLPEDGKSSTTDQVQSLSPLQKVKQLHVLRLLNTSDQFTWSGKIASSSRTYFHVLLRTLCTTSVRALHTTLHELLQHVLATSVLFQEDPTEVDLWLASLPSGIVCRGPDTETPDGAPLTNEVDSVVTFLDECTQRCLKTPYRYMEAMADLLQPSDASSPDAALVDAQVEAVASPLLMTVFEQIQAKINGRLMSPSDALSVFTFVRRLVFKLASKQEETGYRALRTLIEKLEILMASDNLFDNHPSIRGAIRRELSIATACLKHLETGPRSIVREREDARAVDIFLDHVEQMPVPENETARMTSAYELVDWVRLVDVPPTPTDISRLASVIRRFHKPTLKALVDVLPPSEGQLWESNILKVLEEAHIEVDFDWLFVHCSDVQFGDKQCRAKLLRALFSQQITLSDVKRAIQLVLHGIVGSDARTGLTRDLLLLLYELFSGAAASLGSQDVLNLKATVVVQSAFLGLCLSVDIPTEVHDALQNFIRVAFNPASLDDRKVLAPVAAWWADSVKEMLSCEQDDKLRLAKPWIRFMELSELHAALDLIETSQQGPVIHEFLEELLSAVDQSQSSNNKRSVELPIARLLGLQKQLLESPLLEGMIARSLVSQLPVAHDGVPSASLSFEGLASLRLPRHDHLTSLPPDLISQFLERKTWSDSTAQIVAVLLYARASSSAIVVHWLNSKKHERLSTDHLTIIFMAFLDCSESDMDQVIQLDDDVLCGLLEKLLSEGPDLGERRLRRLQCICYVLQQDSQRRPRLTTLLEQKLHVLPLESFAFEAMYIVRHVLAVPGCESLVASLVDRVLQWAVRHISNNSDDGNYTRNAVELLKNVSRSNLKLKPHLVEPLLAVIVKSHLYDPVALDLAVSLLGSTDLKPVVVNRLLQNILQHENFFRFLGKDGTPSQRNEITRLLDGLFRLHPANTCHPSHIEPLVQGYGGTMSTSDRRLLSMMRLFEAEKHTSISPFFSRWSPSPDASATNILEVVQNFDPVRMLRTCLFFPGWRRFGDDGKGVKENPNDEHMYDPLLVIAISAQMLSESPPTTALAWVKLFRSNVVSLLIRCLSSKDVNIREAAACQLTMVFDGIQKSSMQEKSQALYVLQLLKNVMNPTADNTPRRLPTYATLILLHALRGIFYPSNFIYPRTARFLLQRPELDVTDVPMLFNMLYSNSDDWKKERGWMIRMLADGMTSTEDWRVLKRRHTWDLLASLFQGSQKDKALRAGILQVLANLTCNAQACNSLILKSALLSWIEIQLMHGHDGETMAWLRILENIAVIADVSKLQRAMGVEWFAIICRSLSHIVQTSGDQDTGTLSQIAAVVLRLSLTEGTAKHYLEPVLGHAVTYLKKLESRTQLRTSIRPGTASFSPPELPSPPHGAQGLHLIPTVTDPFAAWGTVVEALWRVSMALDGKVPEWDILTSRLLVWRGIVGDDGSQLGEWVRKESIRAVRAYS